MDETCGGVMPLQFENISQNYVLNPHESKNAIANRFKNSSPMTTPINFRDAKNDVKGRFDQVMRSDAPMIHSNQPFNRNQSISNNPGAFFQAQSN